MPSLKPPAYADLIANDARLNAGQPLSTHFNLRHVHSRHLYSSLAPGDNSLDYGNPSYVGTYERKLITPWMEIAVGHTQAIIALNDTRVDPVTQRARPEGDMITAYLKQNEVVNVLYRWMLSSSVPNGWALPVLYTTCRDLRRLAASADAQLLLRGEKATKLEEASRMLQKCFSACLNDRSPVMASSRKMGTYYMATLLFKTYFKLHSTALCKNLIKGIEAADLAPFAQYPIAHRITYNYYLGVFAFLREDYKEAETKFLLALSKCTIKSPRNIELILDYLIPVLLLRGVLPSLKLLRSSSRLAELYTPFVEAIKTGNVALYDEQLVKGEKRLMERGTYLVVERAREGSVRALMKAAWILEGKPARMSIEKFQLYYSRGAGMSTPMKLEEVECIVANLIYKDLMKGYISHQHQLVVLSKDRPFPWYPPFTELGVAKKSERDARELMIRNTLTFSEN